MLCAIRLLPHPRCFTIFRVLGFSDDSHMASGCLLSGPRPVRAVFV